MVMALALVHHLAITHNMPFPKIVQFLSRICSWLIIEFVPKDDGQVQRLLANRQDIFSNYNQDCFEHAFEARFDILEKKNIEKSKRTLYLMKKKDNCS